ncbi:MAG: sensor histidine kinase [Clostridia bacterium]
MKRIIYSTYTKFTAVVLILVCLILCINNVSDTIYRYINEEEKIYNLGERFDTVDCYQDILTQPSVCVSETYNEFYSKGNKLSVDEILKIKLENIDSSNINYFISINDDVYTNCGAVKKEDIKKDEYFFTETRIPNRKTVYEESCYGLNPCINEYDSDDNIVVAVSVKEDYVNECETIWLQQRKYIEDTFIFATVLCIVALLLMIYLIAVSGKTSTGEYKKMWTDLIWTEVHIADIVFVCVLEICALVMMSEIDFYNHVPFYMIKTITISMVCIGTVLIMTSFLSIVRQIKCGVLSKTSVICKIFACVYRIFVKEIKKLRAGLLSTTALLKSNLNKKTGAILICMLFVYTVLIGLCGIFTPDTGLGLFLGIALFVFAAFVIIHRANDIDSIRQGVNEIKSGNITYKIDMIKSSDLKCLANDINEIGNGLDESVAAKIKAERLKTELITNVSHDLKTPLTSIISYTQLLSNVENLPEEAKDYIKIIEQKSERLKNLTRDLFDISKVQSGNEVINIEKLDVSMLINQSLGEHDSEIKNSNLIFCVDEGKNLYASADGRKMSRVMSNLISNILKYSMVNTRVFISAVEKDGEIVIELKNIASYQIEFDTDEIVGRFVRGDKSRTTEGSGLGLAIAKSYTEACGGKFEIVTDGDLFKAIVKLKKA